VRPNLEYENYTPSKRPNSGILLDLSYKLPSGDSGETQPSLTYRDGGYYAIKYPREALLNFTFTTK
jgi:hypothetical protein